MSDLRDRYIRNLNILRKSVDLNRVGSTFQFFVLSIVLIEVIVVLFSREFSGPDGSSSSFYSSIIFNFRWIDIVLLTTSIYILLLIVCFKGRKIWKAMGSSLRFPIFLFGVSIAISFVYGLTHGGKNLFYEWRAIALGMLVGTVFRAFLSQWYLYIMAYSVFLAISVHSFFLVVKWAWLGGVPPFNGPVFDGPTLSNAVAAFAIGTALFLSGSKDKLIRNITYMFMFINVLLVISALRRTYWMELFLVTVVIFLLWRSKRIKFYLFSMLVALVVLGVSVEDLVEKSKMRVFSMAYFFDTANHYASTNIDHLNDVLDAILQIHNSPIFGIGLGTVYQTTFATWKTESWGVHNGPLHVWLRFGLLGLLAYLWFHFRVVRFLWTYRQLVLTRALLAYWVAIFIPPLFFSPWPYGALQNTLLLGILFALVDAEITYWKKTNACYSYHS